MPNRKYSPELQQRAVQLVLDSGEKGAARRIAAQLNINYEMLRRWVRQAEIDRGDRPGAPTDLLAENKQLRKRNAELERANEILRTASAFFAKELDQPRTR